MAEYFCEKDLNRLRVGKLVQSRFSLKQRQKVEIYEKLLLLKFQGAQSIRFGSVAKNS